MKQRDATRSEIVREVLHAYLVQIEFERLRRSGVAAARRRGLFTDQDVFEAVS